MSKLKNNQVDQIPQWQSEKMRIILTQRWKEVWEVVQTRTKDNSNLFE